MCYALSSVSLVSFMFKSLCQYIGLLFPQELERGHICIHIEFFLLMKTREKNKVHSILQQNSGVLYEQTALCGVVIIKLAPLISVLSV